LGRWGLLIAYVKINLSNIVYRLTNQINEKLFATLYNDCVTLKTHHDELNREFKDIQYNYFIKTMSMVDEKCSDEELRSTRGVHFQETYGRYLQNYQDVYSDFIKKVLTAGFGMSGLKFKHFSSSINTPEHLLARTTKKYSHHQTNLIRLYSEKS